MGVHEAIDVLLQDWDEIRALADAPVGERMDDLVRGFTREPIPAVATRRATELVRLVSGLVPRDHPVRSALAAGSSVRFGRVDRDVAALSDWLRTCERFRIRTGTALPTMDTVHAEADAWLLAAESVGEAQLATLGIDPSDPHLIRLTSAEGVPRWPAFQLDPAAIGVVTRINLILDADDDPWGVADWWLGQHAWLPGIPAELIGEVDDEVLVQAAETERAEW